MAWKVEFFFLQEGKTSPVEAFIAKLDKRSIAKVISALDLLREFGPYLKPPYIKKLRNQLYELRIKGVSNIRIFYSFQHGRYIVLHAFFKKTAKTPIREIKLALDRLSNLL
jgi:phage-related protein